MTALLRLRGVGKDYAKVDAGAGRVRLAWNLLRGHASSAVFTALDDVSLELLRGESLGIVGENGAGKSTLLKIIAGVISPTRGSIEVHGRVGALLELGAGFHPEYTGSANIELAAILLGIPPAVLAEKRSEILAFADLGQHIDEPIKHYSSGMVVRLGFAVATAMRPDILITDEVLAVGDESFQKKCIAWMEGYLADGGTLLLCSHSMHHVQKLCRHAVWIKDGRVERTGPATAVTQAYLAYEQHKSERGKPPIPSLLAAAADLYAVQELHVTPRDVRPGADLRIEGDVFSPDGRMPVVLVGIVRDDGTPVYGVSSDMDGVRLTPLDDHHYRFGLDFPALPLLPGRYYVRAHALDPEGVRVFDNVEVPLSVVDGTANAPAGLVRLPHRWTDASAHAARPSPRQHTRGPLVR